MRFELCYGDSFRSNSILSSGDNVHEIYSQIMKHLQENNMNNSLVPDDKMKLWKVFFPILIDNKEKNLFPEYFYAGKNGSGKHCFQKTEGTSDLYVMDETHKIRVYIGTETGKQIFAKNDKGSFISDINHHSLSNKDFYFIRKK